MHTLRSVQSWALQPDRPGRFDASALLRMPDGTWRTVNDKTAGLHQFTVDDTRRVLDVKMLPGWFTPDSLNQALGRQARLHDLEALAIDGAGRIYVADESSRAIFRQDNSATPPIALPIDWSEHLPTFSRNGNSSWEGLAIGGDRLYVANERDPGRIFTVDLNRFKVLDSFRVAPPGAPAANVHYSALAWFDGDLWVLCRESQCVLQVDPQRQKVRASFRYHEIENSREHGYFRPLPFGYAEGLEVDAEHLWLVIDNNGAPRLADATDTRPSLWRIPRPDRGTTSKGP